MNTLTMSPELSPIGDSRFAPNVRLYSPHIVLLGNWREQHALGLALDTLKDRSETARKLITEVDYLNGRKGHKLKIKYGPMGGCNCMRCVLNPVTNAFDPNKNLIAWTPIGCMYDGSRPWMCPPQEILLGHELVHAHHKASDDFHLISAHQMWGEAHRREEFRTVGLGEYANERLSENAIRRDYGISQRPAY